MIIFISPHERSPHEYADPAIIGGRITISGESLVVVGILPRDFRFPFWNTEIWRADTFERGPAATASEFPRAYVRFAAHTPQQDALRVGMEAARAADSASAKLWPRVRLNRVAPLESFYVEQLARPRAAAALGFAFAAIAVAAGLFSVLTFAVGRRRKEFGVRTALGTSPSQIRQLVLRDGFAITLTGVALGTLAAWSVARTLASLQYGVTVGDPVSWVIVISLLGATAMLASWRPTAQAVRADPVQLLREE